MKLLEGVLTMAIAILVGAVVGELLVVLAVLALALWG